MYHRFWLIPTCSPIPIPYLKCLSLSFFASSVGTSLADSCLASSRHLKLLKRSDVPAQTISHPIPVINGEGDAPRPCNFHINHYFWQSPYIMSFKTCSHCFLHSSLHILCFDICIDWQEEKQMTRLNSLHPSLGAWKDSTLCILPLGPEKTKKKTKDMPPMPTVSREMPF